MNSLTNECIVQMLTHERKEELLKLLLSDRRFWVVVKSTSDCNGIVKICLTKEDAVTACYNSIKSDDWAKDRSETLTLDGLRETLRWESPEFYGHEWYIFSMAMS